jgi:hypothetical protein
MKVRGKEYGDSHRDYEKNTPQKPDCHSVLHSIPSGPAPKIVISGSS